MNFRPGLPFGLCKICFRQDIHLNIFIGHFTYHECQFYMIAGIWTIYFIITEISLMIHVTPFYNGTGLDWGCIWLFFINIISFCEQFSLCSLILGSPESQRWTTVMCLDKSLTLNEQCQFFFFEDWYGSIINLLWKRNPNLTEFEIDRSRWLWPY